ncbi:DUF6245 family protein [Nonomuraea jabiensis]|uniref:DUF6245 family protein n=1 Tax=Nonomuraea jabiensis TaxID=882448 RepID=UPI003D75A46C
MSTDLHGVRVLRRRPRPVQGTPAVSAMGDAAPRQEQPASMQQLVAALMALGMYRGEGSQAEHDTEQARFGMQLYQVWLVYQVWLANAPLGVAQIETICACSAKHAEAAATAAAITG